MFIREKKIGKYRYAYLVENKWKKGQARQTNKAYLGKVFSFNISPEEIFKNELSSLLTEQPFRQGINLLASRALLNVGFTSKGKKEFEKDFLLVSLSKDKILAHGRKCVLSFNKGYFCEHTLSQLHSFKYKGEPLREMGFRLANLLSLSGLPITKNEFVSLSARAISEYEISNPNKDSDEVDFYY